MGLARLKVAALTAAFAFLMLVAVATIRPAKGEGPADPDGIVQATQAIPRDPPRADLITFGPVDGLGEATVTGAPGAVLPDAHVLLVNLESAHQAYIPSEPDGSFSTRIFAPPGSDIMIKHGPPHTFQTPDFAINPWRDVEDGAIEIGRTVFPSTTIHRPHRHAAAPDAVPFASAGAFGVNVDTSPTSIDAGWSMTGTIGPVSSFHPGGAVTAEATVRLYSRAIVSATDTSTITFGIHESSSWLMLYDDDGTPMPYNAFAGASRLTPGGFPILDSRRPEVKNPVTSSAISWQFIGGHTLEGHVSLTFTLDESMPPGLYRPLLHLNVGGVPADSEWRAALLSVFAGITSFNADPTTAALPPIAVTAPISPSAGRPDDGHSRRLIWYLLMNNPSLGIRGAGAQQDAALFQPSSLVVTQGAPYVLPPVDAATGEPVFYRLEPYLPMISYGRGTSPGPPLIPFDLPGGELCVTIHEPDGAQRDLGCAAFAQSVGGDRATDQGELINFGTIEISEYYRLTTADENFTVSFVQPGYHAIEMSGWVEDVWGNRYEGGGTYEVWVAHPLDLDPGLLPGTPLAVGDAVNPTVQLHPRLPAYVNLTVHHFPYSDPALMETHVIEGWANRFGHFAPDSPPITLDEPGEYRLDLFAEYVDPATGDAYAAAATWGGVVMTPRADAQLVAHGLRGIDSVTAIPGPWYILDDLCEQEENVLEGSEPHVPNPYLNGDIIWSRLDLDVVDHHECIGDALYLSSSVHDTVGDVENAIVERFDPVRHRVGPPGSFDERVLADELPLFSSTNSGLPVSLAPEDADQIAYAYLSSQRPGARVREAVAEDAHGTGYWRFDATYDLQPGVGLEGDLPNDIKYQFVGAVYRDLESGLSEYLGQATGWVHLPDDDTVGSRVMPPFSGPGNGGWPTDGGPLMTLKGEDVHIFIMPTAVRPGAVLQVGDRFDFAGHIMPTLDSRVQVEVTAPGGQTRVVDGRANSIGYFYAPEDGFELDEAGRWTATVRVWHDGQIGSGEQVNCDPADPFDPSLPCPSGDLLGSVDGAFSFYVVSPGSPRLAVASPAPGHLTFGEEIPPIEVSGPLPPGVDNAAVDYTISMPGFILEEGQAQTAGGAYSLTFDPQTLHDDFPNLDLIGHHAFAAGLSDTFSFGLLLSGEADGRPVHQATTLTIQGDQVYVESAEDVVIFSNVLLPAVLGRD